MKIRNTLITIGIYFWVLSTFAQLEYYASNRVVNSINKYDENGVFVETIIEENAGGLNSPQDIIFHPDGYMLVSSSSSNAILKFDISTGDFIEVWNQDSVTRPTKMAIGPDNLLYVTQWGQAQQTSRILKFNLDGTLVGPVTDSPTPLGMGMVWDTDGNYYVALYGLTTGAGTVEKFNSGGISQGTFIDSANLGNPTYIWWDTNGDMLVQDWTGGKVIRYSSNGDYIEDHLSGLANPEGFAHLPNGNLILVERIENKITEFTPDGTEVGQWDSGIVLEDPNLLVMRDPSLSVDDHAINAALVTPTVGSVFQFNSDLLSEITLLSIYNYAGILIQHIKTENKVSWNAGALADGMYFIVAEGVNGKRMVQKIVVSKE